MKKRHIVKVGFYYFATESMTAATQLINLLSKVEPCEYDYRDDHGGKFYFPKTDRDFDIKLECNQKWKAPEQPKEGKGKKPKGLPAPVRGSIRCTCGHSDVSPKSLCPHCGRTHLEVLNRTGASD